MRKPSPGKDKRLTLWISQAQYDALLAVADGRPVAVAIRRLLDGLLTPDLGVENETNKGIENERMYTL